MILSKLYTKEFELFRDFETENDRSFGRMMPVAPTGDDGVEIAVSAEELWKLRELRRTNGLFNSST